LPYWCEIDGEIQAPWWLVWLRNVANPAEEKFMLSNASPGTPLEVIGLADLMTAAGLTHGGFYKHFESKDQLVAEACAEAVGVLIGKVQAAASGGRGAAAATYLSTAHRDNPATGCPLCAIGSELSRSDKQTRAVATDGFRKLVEIMAGQFGKIPPKVAKRRALVAVSTMIGALTMSRILTDPELSAEVLKEAEKSLAVR
jgi:TetR/AcrR family transcriptional repressor of nem operon